MRSWLILISLFATMGCEAQLQKWQRDRTVEHLSRLKTYHGNIKWSADGESAEAEVWFKGPSQFLMVSQNGEAIRRDGATMEIYDRKANLYSVFTNLPMASAEQAQKLIRDVFDQAMDAFTFTLGPLGKVAGRQVIELRSKPKGHSVVQNAESQIFDEFSFPLKSTVKFQDGQVAQYEFLKIEFNEKFDLPKMKAQKDAYKMEWDFNSGKTDLTDAAAPRGLKLEKTLKHEMGMVFSYYRNGAQFLSVIRYKNLGRPPKRGIALKVGAKNAFLLPGTVSNFMTVSVGEMTTAYTTNLLIDDLVAFASKQ